jgi:N-acetylglucosaminyldiphosphoundecaprenol N-acetyl-beta-D-mannosaminyltransferase
MAASHRPACAFHEQDGRLRATVVDVTDTFEPSLALSAPSLTEFRTYRVCRTPIADLDTTGAAARIVQAAANRTSFEVHLCNAYTLSLVDRDPLLRDALTASHMNLADGTPVAWMGRSEGEPGPVRGPGLVGAVAALGVGVAHHYLWGGKEGVADGMADGLRAAVPGVSVVGTEVPPFAPLSDEDLFDLAVRVRASGANILWVGLGTPKQDYVVRRLAPLLNMPIVPVGAAFDFWAGAVAEAPAFLHGSGLEWIYRLSREPRRLWRRYLIGNPRFVMSAVRHRTT